MASPVSGQEPIQIAWKISHLRVKHLIGFVRETLSSSAMLSHYYQHPVVKALVNDVSATVCPRLQGPLQATAQFPHMFHTDTRYLSRTSSYYMQPLRRARAQHGHPLITDIFVG